MTSASTIIDSALSLEEAILDNPHSPAPEWLREQLVVIDLKHWSYDGEIHQGQLVVHQIIEEKVRDIFKEMFEKRCPIKKIIPLPVYKWDDESSMQDNNSSAYNYRFIPGTEKLSYHALGLAIDIDPLLNPLIKNNEIRPRGATYSPAIPGTLTSDSDIVQIFKKHGFDWGGDWLDERGYVDYQHFAFIRWDVDGVEWLQSQ